MQLAKAHEMNKSVDFIRIFFVGLHIAQGIPQPQIDWFRREEPHSRTILGLKDELMLANPKD